MIESAFNKHTDANGVVYSIYSLTKAQLRQFANLLINPSIIDSWKMLLYKDPIDAVISVRAFPVRNPIAQASNIKIGSYDTGISAARIRSAIQEFIEAEGVMFPDNGTYTDYAPYTRIDLYLPFIGFVNVDPAFVIGKYLKFKYIIDFTTGAFSVWIQEGRYTTDNNNILYTFNGQMGTAIPLSSSNRAENIASQAFSGITAAASLAAGVGTGGAGFALAGIASAGANIVNASREHINRGNIGDGYLSFANCQHIFALVRKVREVGTGSYYASTIGFPNHTTGKVGDYIGTGYLKMIECHVSAAGATDTERDMIEQKLKTGVIV